MRLTDTTLPSGRKLAFRWEHGQFTCDLVSSISDNVLCAGKGANRLDALYACALEAYETGYRHDAIRHVRYWQKLWIELYGLWREVRPAPKPRQQADPWQVVR